MKMRNSMKMIIFALVLSSSFSFAAEPPRSHGGLSVRHREYIAHTGGSFVCTVLGSKGLVKYAGQGKLAASIEAFVVCTALGFLKEYAIDPMKDDRDIRMNAVGAVSGLVFISW